MKLTAILATLLMAAFAWGQSGTALGSGIGLSPATSSDVSPLGVDTTTTTPTLNESTINDNRDNNFPTTDEIERMEDTSNFEQGAFGGSLGGAGTGFNTGSGLGTGVGSPNSTDTVGPGVGSPGAGP